jgi:tetratricopeptide (TPR) repeat protein
MVTALGALDRSSADTRTALLAELRNPAPAVSAAAAAALEQFRNQREIVRPLLDYLATVKGSSQEAVGVRINVLAAIASNSPSGVLDLLTPYTESEQPPAVRAKAMQAVIACDEIDTSLDALAQTWRDDPATEVRFSLAAALGDRLARLPPEAGAEARQGMVQQLGHLLRDTEASVRLEAAASLGRSGSSQALALLETQARTETDRDVQKGLIQAVGALRQPQGARVIGALLSAHKDGRDGLLDEAKKALATMAGDRGPEPWLDAAAALDAVGTHDLAAYCCLEVVSRFGSKPEHAEAVVRANDVLVHQLLAAGQAAEARTRLLALEENNADKPPRAERQFMLAEACRLLGNWAEQAEWLKAHLKDLPAGDARRAPETLAAAQALHKAGKDADALPLLSEYLLAQPADNQALMDRAAVEEALGKPEEALADLDMLLGRLPDGDALREPAQAAHARLKERTAGPVGPPAPQSEPRSEAAAPGESGSPHGN